MFDEHWRKYAERLVDSHVTLIPEPQTESQLVTQLKAHDITKHSKGVKGVDYVAAIFTVGLSSESITDPHLRGAPFKKERLTKLGKSWLRARHDLHAAGGEAAPATLLPGDMFIALDNQKSGLVPKLTNFLKDGQKSHFTEKRFTLVYDFDSVKNRKQRIKGVGTVNQTETMVVATLDNLSVPARQHKHYMGMNTGSVISHIKLPSFSDCWCLSFDLKKQIYAKLRLPVGGKTGGDDDDDDGDAPEGGEEQEVPPTIETFDANVAATGKKAPTVRAGANIEPLSYNSMPVEFFDDLLHSFAIKDLYDFTPCDGVAALACIRAKKGYVAVCFTDAHADHLRKRLVEQVLKALGTPNDDLHDSKYSAGIQSHAPGVVPKPKVPKPKAKTEKDNKNTKKEKKDKKKKKDKSSESSSSSSSDSGQSA